MRILLATQNPHKLVEMRSASAGSGLDWVLLGDIAAERGIALPPEPDEPEPTFEGNALIKARFYAAWAGMPAASDDSGLAVDALGGAPGVRSARYSGLGDTRDERDAANNAKLLDALGDRPAAARTARFVCALALAWPDDRDIDGKARPPIVVRGEVPGRVLTAPRGSNGFGYDPLFELTGDTPPFAGRTTAELAPAEKDAISHRGRAVRALVERLGGDAK